MPELPSRWKRTDAPQSSRGRQGQDGRVGQEQALQALQVRNEHARVLAHFSQHPGDFFLQLQILRHGKPLSDACQKRQNRMHTKGDVEMMSYEKLPINGPRAMPAPAPQAEMDDETRMLL